MLKKSQRNWLLIPVLFAVVMIAGCSQKSTTDTMQKKHVLTTFTVIEDMAKNVAGDAATVESITKVGAEIHEYEPTPKDIIKAQSADLVLRNGFDLERWFEKFMTKVRDVKNVDLSDGIEPIIIAEGPYGGLPNPHSWMSPKNALIYVENIRQSLNEIDPENAAVYDANAKTYSEQINQIDEKLRAAIEQIPQERRWLVTSEGAFSYLARDYNMKELFLWPVNADSEGTPQQIQKVVDGIREHHIPVGFSESTVSPKPMQQVTKESGAKYGGVLYVDSLTNTDGTAPTYLDMLRYNIDLIVHGFEEK